MEINLAFKITFASGEETVQDIKIEADPKHPVEKQRLYLMQQMFNQYAQVGLLREPAPGKFHLVLPSQLKTVECELPSVILADASDIPSIQLQ